MKTLRGKIFNAIIIAFILIYILFPMVVLIMYAFAEKWYAQHWWAPQKVGFKWFREILLLGEEIPRAFFYSYTIAFIVTGLTLLIAFCAGYVLGTKKFKSRNMMEQISNIPFAFPAVTLGIALLPVYARLGMLRTYWGVVLVHMVGAIPFALRVIIGTFRAISPDIEEAARNLGANRLTVLRRIYLPLTWQGVIAGGIFAFTWSLNEFVLTLLVGFPTILTLPVEVSQYIGEYFLSPQRAAVIGLFLLIPTAILLYIADKYITIETMGKG